MMVLVERPVDARLTFDRAVEAYDEVRPSYPDALLDELFRMLPPAPEILEVGPGTGQATRGLLARGASVHAVEIGAAMARRLRANLPVDRLRVSIGDFERLLTEPGSADAVFAATAYHWIRPTAQTDRPARILRPAGVLAVVDLVQVTSPSDRGFFTAAQPIYQSYGQGHSGPPAPTRTAVEPPVRAVIEADSRFHSVTVLQYDWDQTYTAPQYRTLMLSYSSTQLMDEQDRIALLDEVERFIATDFGGRITRPLVVTLTTGVRGR